MKTEHIEGDATFMIEYDKETSRNYILLGEHLQVFIYPEALRKLSKQIELYLKEAR